MRDDVYIRNVGEKQYLISQDDAFSFRAVINNGITYLSICDIAKCCGYKAPNKLAQVVDIEKVKISSNDGRNVKGKFVTMWYMTVDTAIDFVKARSMKEAFTRWFLEDAVVELKNLEAPKTAPIELPQPKQERGRSVDLSAHIDRLIVELLALRQEIS